MIYILAIFLPFLAVMLRGRIMTGIVLLLLQITLFGWIPAILIAFFVVHNADADKRHRETIAVLQTGTRK